MSFKFFKKHFWKIKSNYTQLIIMKKPSTIMDLYNKEHVNATQSLHDMSCCFKLGFMAANLAIIVAIREIDRRIAATMAFILLILVRGGNTWTFSMCFSGFKIWFQPFFFSKLIRWIREIYLSVFDSACFIKKLIFFYFKLFWCVKNKK